MEGEDEREDVIRNGLPLPNEVSEGDYLRVSIDGMESMGGIRGCDDPFVVWFMKSLVYQRVMETAMNPVD